MKLSGRSGVPAEKSVLEHRLLPQPIIQLDTCICLLTIWKFLEIAINMILNLKQ